MAAESRRPYQHQRRRMPSGDDSVIFGVFISYDINIGSEKHRWRKNEKRQRRSSVGMAL